MHNKFFTMKKLLIFVSLLMFATAFAGNEPVNRFIEKFKNADIAFEQYNVFEKDQDVVPNCAAISPSLAASLSGQPIPGNPWGNTYNPIEDYCGVWVVSFMEAETLNEEDWTPHEFCPFPDPCEEDPENCE